MINAHKQNFQILRLVSFPRRDYVPAMSEPPADTTFIMREDPWRIFRIMAEFVDSFQSLAKVGSAVTIFGSARTKPDDKYYHAAHDIAKRLAKHNLAVITGGGPGVMEAANNGAAQGRGKTERHKNSLTQMITNQQDAPTCPNCGNVVVRNGACYKCLNCGESLGCS